MVTTLTTFLAQANAQLVQVGSKKPPFITNHNYEFVPNTPIYKDTGLAFVKAHNLDNELIAPEKIVKVGHSTFYNLIGSVDQNKLKNYLSHFGYIPQRIGNVDLIVGVTQNRDFVGCGCPEEFKEFSIMVFIKSKRRGTLQVAAMRFRANNPQRIASMGSKFGTLIIPGIPHHEYNNMGTPVGISLNDVQIDEFGQWQDSTLVLKAIHHKELPDPRKSKMISYIDNELLNMDIENFGLHSLGSREASLNQEGAAKKYALATNSELNSEGKIDLENEQMKEIFYRIAKPVQSKDQLSISLFDYKRDTLELNKDTEIGKFLVDLNFQPKYWSTILFENAFAWIPVQ
jgi:hypothetical protein